MEIENKHNIFGAALLYLWRLDKKDNDIIACFIFPKGMQFDLRQAEGFVEVISVLTSDLNTGLRVKFKSIKLGQWFWDNWKRNYKYDTDNENI